jgi:uncharacterized membrane protein
MNWGQKFRFQQYWKNNLWMIPVLCAFVGAGLAFSTVTIDKQSHWFGGLSYNESVAISLLAALLGATVSFTGFVFTMLLLVPQFAGAQLSPRVLQYLYRDGKLKLTFGLLVGSMVYVFIVLSNMRGGFVPRLSLWLAGVLVITSILVFVAFVSHFIQNLRPATAASAVANVGYRIIQGVYPQPYSGEWLRATAYAQLPGDSPTQLLRHTGLGGTILSLCERDLVALAERTGGVLVLPRAVGDYVANGSVIVEVWGADKRLAASVVREMIPLGAERTFEQDPRLAFRILVDIAIKALSPAINDPTTAVQLLDRIEGLLMELLKRDLSAGVLRDSAGRLRVLVPFPTWDEYLNLALTEIRHFGYNSVQVVRRMRWLLEDLAEVAPMEYQDSIAEQLARLDQSIVRGFPDELDMDWSRGSRWERVVQQPSIA